ncbi:MAG: heparan-alpha-glucosaminide N-acetyltransferase domain-containing protein [Thermodesulfobacteriota bacterium]
MEKFDRLLALDTFRGITIASMIIVNFPGSFSHVYAPLSHSKWHGCTPTDLIFPFFLFIVGVAISYSFRKFDDKTSLFATSKIAKRALIIFLIGLALNAFPFNSGISDLRILGVLQRIGIAYGIAALFCLYFNSKKLTIISGIILIIYWLLLLGFGQGDPYGMESNLVRVIDLRIFGENHLWKGIGIPFDPEGLLSTLPAVVTTIFGYLAGESLQTKSNLKSFVYCMFLVGVTAILIGKIWGITFPINKSLWTSSYVVYTSGWALIFLSILLWFIDVQGYKKWTFPFVVFGMNPLFLYVLSIVWLKIYISLIKITKADGSVVNGVDWLYNQLFVPAAGYLNGSLLFAVTHVLIFWIILLILYSRKIFIKI